jgi:hypothetical protein
MSIGLGRNGKNNGYDSKRIEERSGEPVAAANGLGCHADSGAVGTPAGGTSQVLSVRRQKAKSVFYESNPVLNTYDSARMLATCRRSTAAFANQSAKQTRKERDR